MAYMAKNINRLLICTTLSMALLTSCDKKSGDGRNSLTDGNRLITLTVDESYWVSITPPSFTDIADTAALKWESASPDIVSIDSLSTIVSFERKPDAALGVDPIKWDTIGITVTTSAKITAKREGETTVSVSHSTDKWEGKNWIINVRPGSSGGLTEDDGVVLNGVTWATRNVNTPGFFVANPEDYGFYYQWNSHTGWSVTSAKNGWDESWNGDDTISWIKINDPCPKGWRIPTYQELDTLAKIDSRWETRKNTVDNREVNVSGRVFEDGSNTLFLPAAGYLSREGTYYEDHLGGFYWGGEVYSDGVTYRYPYCFSFGSSEMKVGDNFHFVGFSCRCVKE